MATNEEIGVKACLTDLQFRKTLKYHNTDQTYVSKELDRIGIVFKNDPGDKIRQGVLDLIAKTDWSKLSESLETALSDAEGILHPLMG